MVQNIFSTIHTNHIIRSLILTTTLMVNYIKQCINNIPLIEDFSKAEKTYFIH